MIRQVFIVVLSSAVFLLGTACIAGVNTSSGDTSDLPDPDLSIAEAGAVLASEQPAWLYPADACPADVMPPKEEVYDPNFAACERSYSLCLRDCKGGDGNACQAAAHLLEEFEAEGATQALFLRACSLGISSGCTNRAASMMETSGASSCLGQTFRATCDRADPWGCTMYGLVTLQPSGIAEDDATIRAYLTRACELAPNEDSCFFAQQLLEDFLPEE